MLSLPANYNLDIIYKVDNSKNNFEIVHWLYMPYEKIAKLKELQ